MIFIFLKILYMSGYKKFNNHHNKNQNGNRRSQQRESAKPRVEKKQFPPPDQVVTTISTQNIFNLCQTFIAANDYGELKKVAETLRMIRRAIMRVKCDSPCSIDLNVIHAIESSEPVSGILPSFMVTSQTMPTMSKEYNPYIWSAIHRAMLPNLLPIQFTSEAYQVFVDIYSNIMLSEYSIRREQIMHENEVAMSKEINRLNKKDADYDAQVAEIKKKYDVQSYTEYHSYKETSIWQHKDEYDAYMKAHDPSDISDPMIEMIWSVITMNPIICTVEGYVSELITDTKIFFMQYIDAYDDSAYFKLIKKLRNHFFSEYPDYTNETCDEFAFEKWKVINKYCEILLQLFTFKHSNRTIQDIITYDMNLCKILKTTTIAYKKVTTRVPVCYSEINLESQRCEKRVTLTLNKLSEEMFDVHSRIITELFPADVVVKTAIEQGVKSKVLCKQYVRLMKLLGPSDEAQLIIDGIKIKDDNYWNFYAALIYEGVLKVGDDFIEKVIDSIVDNEKKVDVLLGFASAHVFGEFVKYKETLSKLCDEWMKKTKGMLQCKVMDAIDLLNA